MELENMGGRGGVLDVINKKKERKKWWLLYS